ncbi:hypothetical protein ACFQLX_16015 [Streptomyces polyrhachis]|uniref:Uncharacterized protein n=1 Tax=Streptomyces polyrhachis TaxID=1282885 RepID=A0ABW2GG10_9ACTN
MSVSRFTRMVMAVAGAAAMIAVSAQPSVAAESGEVGTLSNVTVYQGSDIGTSGEYVMVICEGRYPTSSDIFLSEGACNSSGTFHELGQI